MINCIYIISKLIAVKIIPTEKFKNQLDKLKQETDIMKNLEHPNIVKLYYASRTNSNIYLFLEFCQDGNLETHFHKKEDRLSELDTIRILSQISDAFQYLYHKNIIHRDIKP